MQGTSLLPSLPGPLWPEVVAPDMGPIYGLNRTNSILMLNWNHTYIQTACWCSTELFEIELVFDIETVFTPNWIV